MSDEYAIGAAAAAATAAPSLQEKIAAAAAQDQVRRATIIQIEKENLRIHAARHQRLVETANEALSLMDENPIIEKYLNLIQELRSNQA